VLEALSLYVWNCITHASFSRSALMCLLLQISLLVTVLGGLSVLRKDAEVLVLGPLRSMLKIVAQYAKNPLSSARTGSKEAGSDDDTEGDDSRREPSRKLRDGTIDYRCFEDYRFASKVLG
jgi:hypothetical protein